MASGSADGAARPCVALTTSVISGASPQQLSVFLYTNYVTTFERLGIATILLTPAHAPDSIDALLDASHGLVLTGGEDVEPARYGAAPSPALGAVNTARDALEFRAVEAALARDLPIFGICRGAQVLNVYFGGTLYQDLDSERPGHLRHEQQGTWGTRAHHVHVEPGSHLHEIVGTERLHINSFHHQAVKELGTGLRATARSDDGLIEAVEAVDHGWVLGVQWHPERHEASTHESDPDRRLFAGFRNVLRAQIA